MVLCTNDDNLLIMEIKKNTPLKEVLRLGRECRRRNNCCSYGSGCLAGNDIKNIAKFLRTTEIRGISVVSEITKEFLNITEKELKEKYLEEVEKFNTKLLRPKLIRKDKPYGRCIFFDGSGCKIHKAKPLECKIGNCGEHGEELSKWFMLNYCININDPESIRQYAIYLKTNRTLKGGELKNLVPKERLRKILSFEVLK